MVKDEEITTKILDFSTKIGIDIIGFADPILYDRFPEENRPNYYLKNAKTVIIIGLHLHDLILDAWSHNPHTGKDFHFLDAVLENFCHRIKNFLEKNDYIAKIIPYSPGLYLKDSAALAGIGPIGKNNLLITEKFGSQVRLRAIVTNAQLKTGKAILESEYCKNCQICINNCPSNALSGGKYNRVQCLSYNLSNLKKLSDATSIWCNKCIEVCPITKKLDKEE